jgi:hypothetical protein
MLRCKSTFCCFPACLGQSSTLNMFELVSVPHAQDSMSEHRVLGINQCAPVHVAKRSSDCKCKPPNMNPHCGHQDIAVKQPRSEGLAVLWHVPLHAQYACRHVTWAEKVVRSVSRFERLQHLSKLLRRKVHQCHSTTHTGLRGVHECPMTKASTMQSYSKHMPWNKFNVT